MGYRRTAYREVGPTLAESKEPGGDSKHDVLIGIVSAGALGILEIGAQIASGGVSAVRFVVLLVAAAAGGLAIYFALVRSWGRATVLGTACLVLLGLVAAFGPAARQSVTQPKPSTEISSPSGGLTPKAPPTTTPALIQPPASGPVTSSPNSSTSTSPAAVDRLGAARKGSSGGLTLTVDSVTEQDGDTHVHLTARNTTGKELTLETDFGNCTMNDDQGDILPANWGASLDTFFGTVLPDTGFQKGTVIFTGTLTGSATVATLRFSHVGGLGPDPGKRITVSGLTLEPRD